METDEMKRRQPLRVMIKAEGREPEVVESREDWSRLEAQAFVEEQFPEAWYGGHGVRYAIMTPTDVWA